MAAIKAKHPLLHLFDFQHVVQTKRKERKEK
jgi:hypothetical protein